MTARQVVVALVLLTAACNGQSTQLTDGSYAGSTAASQEVTIDVQGGKMTFDGKKTDRGKNRTFIQHDPPHTVISCKPAPEHELVCTLSALGGTETVHLMRL